MPSTPQAFYAAMRGAQDAADRHAYAALFELPSISYVEGGPQTLRRPADLDVRLRRIVAAMRDLGVLGHTVEFLSIRPYASHLLAVRAAVRFRLEDRLETDEREEFWVLRERDGRLRLCLTVNSTVGNMVEQDGAPAWPAPASPGRVEDAAPFLEAMEETFNRRDAAGHAALLDTPFLRIADHGTDAVHRPERHLAAARRFFSAVDRAGVAGIALAPVAERPYGRDYALLRVEVVVVHEDGRRADPYEELWVLRRVDGGLRLGAIVNPFAPRFLSQDLPHRRPT